MPIIKPRNHTVIDIYKSWCNQKIKEDNIYVLEYDAYYKRDSIRVLLQIRPGGDRKVVMTYALFRNILETYNKIGVEHVIEGGRFEIGNRMGYLEAKRVERNFNHPRINHIATKRARDKEPDHPAIYYTDEDYCAIAWVKSHQLKNESVYSFVPANYSFREKFSKTLNANPILKYNYKYYPYIPKTT